MSFVQRAVLRSSIFAGLVLASAVGTGCRDEAASNAAAASDSAAGPGGKQPAVAQVNVDPVVTKTYRVEACYYGTLALHQARVAYLGSLNGAEPSADHIPDFGAVTDENVSARPPVPLAGTPPAASGSARPAAPPKPSAAASAKPAASSAPHAASAAPSAASDKKLPMDPNRKIRQVRYEYFARMCKTAAGIKTPAAPELDGLLNDYATFAMNLSKDIADANTYYQKEDYKNDAFAKGKELHGKITEQFKKIDDYDKKLGDAIKDFESKNTIDRSAWGESQKLADAVVVTVRTVFEDLDQPKIDAAKAKADLGKMDEAIDALKKYGTDHKDAQDPYAQIVAPAGERVAKQAHDILDAADFKTPAPHQMVALATFFEQVLDGNYRALLKQLRTEAGGAPGFGDKIPRMPNGHPMLPVQRKPE